MKKILFVITKSNWGGAQRYVFDLAESLPKSEFNVAVALGGTGGKGATAGVLESKLKDKNVRTIFVQSFMRNISLFKELGALRELIQIFKNERPDVVHLNSSKAGGIGALAARLVGVKKIVFTVHGLPHREDRGLLWRLVARLGTHTTALLCHEIIVVSSSDKQDLPAARLIHNGIAPIVFAEREAARAQLAQKFDLGSPEQRPNLGESLWIGALGELTWNKGYHYLVRAASQLKQKGVDFELCIIGEGVERTFLETLIADEDLTDRVHLTGFVEGASEYLKAFDIFALSSTKEGLPYVLMEAGLAGSATVATNVGGVSDIVGDKVSGLLAKPKNQHDLADKLEHLIKDPALRETYGSALKTRVEQEFSLEKMVKETAALY